jgi:hypothetical protein
MSETTILNPPLVAEPPHPMTVFHELVRSGTPASELRELLAMAREVDKWKAEKEFAAAFVRAKKRIYAAPPIIKIHKNEFTKSFNAALEEIQFVVEPILLDEGFALTYGEGKAEHEGEMRVTATLMHIAGHSKEYFKDLPYDGEGAKGGKSSMNPIQGRGSSTTYGQRYILVPMFNIPLVGMDNDGAKFATLVGEEQCIYLQDLITETNADFPAFMDWVSSVAKRSVTKLDEIPFAIYEKVREKLLEKQRAQQARKAGAK